MLRFGASVLGVVQNTNSCWSVGVDDEMHRVINISYSSSIIHMCRRRHPAHGFLIRTHKAGIACVLRTLAMKCAQRPLMDESVTSVYSESSLSRVLMFDAGNW